MNNKIICALTGKNIWQIGNGQSEAYYKNVNIKLSIIEKVSELIAGGVTDFLLNAEYGFPLWAAEILISLRDIRIQQGINSFRVYIVMPHEKQAADWNDDIHERFYNVHEKADDVLILYKHYRDDCYEKCERFMIDQCNFLLTDDETAFATQYATIHNKPIVICEQLTHV